MEEQKESGKQQCKEGHCCSTHRCCGAKVLGVLVLLLLGGIVGYLMGSHGGNYYGHFGYPCPMGAPAPPVK